MTHAHPTKSETAAEKAAAREEARLDKLDATAESKREVKNDPSRDAQDARLDAVTAADRRAALSTPAPVAPKVLPSTFPERTAGFPKAGPLVSITVNGDLKTAKDGVRSEMTCGELAGLDKITPEKFVRLEMHDSVRKDGKTILTDVNAAVAVTSGLEFVIVTK